MAFEINKNYPKGLPITLISTDMKKEFGVEIVSIGGQVNAKIQEHQIGKQGIKGTTVKNVKVPEATPEILYWIFENRVKLRLENLFIEISEATATDSRKQDKDGK